MNPPPTKKISLGKKHYSCREEMMLSRGAVRKAGGVRVGSVANQIFWDKKGKTRADEKKAAKSAVSITSIDLPPPEIQTTAGDVSVDTDEEAHATQPPGTPWAAKPSTLSSRNKKAIPIPQPTLGDESETDSDDDDNGDGDAEDNLPTTEEKSSRRQKELTSWEKSHMELDFDLLTTTQEGVNRRVPTNRAQLNPTLAQHFLVESISRILDSRLNWLRDNQGAIFSMTRENHKTFVQEQQIAKAGRTGLGAGGSSGGGGGIDAAEASMRKQLPSLRREVRSQLNQSSSSSASKRSRSSLSYTSSASSSRKKGGSGLGRRKKELRKPTRAPFEDDIMNTNDNDLDDLGNNDPGGVDSEYSSHRPLRKGQAFLPDSSTGSPRHLKVLAMNALMLVSEFGKGHIFMTATCNTSWPEFKERLPPGQNAYTRPDVTCEIFHQRLEALKHNLRNGKYFGGKLHYLIAVIECQQRGLPHCHLVMRLANGPDHSNLGECAEFIDAYISAELPQEYTTEDLIGLQGAELAAMEDNIRYYNLMKKDMTHDCKRGGCKTEGNDCKWRYPHPVIATTHFDDKGIPHYRRRHACDANIVPHNREMLLDWDGHLNVEFCGTTFSLLYLYKYCFKGNRKVSMELNNIDDVEKGDEINLHIRGRFLPAMDAMWRILRYPNYPPLIPSVLCVKVSLPAAIEFLVTKRLISRMWVYLQRPRFLVDMLYTDFYKQYNYSTRKPARFSKNNEDSENCFSLMVAHAKTPYTLFVFRLEERRIVRMHMNFCTAGEIWYIRQLLLNFPVTGRLENLLTINGPDGPTICETFQQAAVARDVVPLHQEALMTFAEALQPHLSLATPRELRALFVILASHGYPMRAVYDAEGNKEAMWQDFWDQPSVHQQTHLALERLLLDLSWRLEDIGKNLQQLGLPSPQNASTILERARLMYDANQQRQQLEQLERDYPMTAEQQIVFTAFTEAFQGLTFQERLATTLGDVDEIPGFEVYTQAPAGSGKTVLTEKLLCYARANALLSVSCAATSLAATSITGSYTTHALFCIPVIEDEDDQDNSLDLVSYADSRPGHMEFLRAVKFITWDEFPSNHKQCYSTAKKLLQNFRGKCMAYFGDNQQIPPVVKSTLFRDIFNATIMSHESWPLLTVHELTGNLRVQDISQGLPPDATPEQRAYIQRQIDFVDLLAAIGKGSPYVSTRSFGVVGGDSPRYEPESAMLWINPELVRHFHDIEEALLFLYPNGSDDVMDVARAAAILCIANADVDMFNTRIQAMNSNDMRTYIASNVFDDIDDPYNHIKSMLTPSVLARYEKIGVPPNELNLKVTTVFVHYHIYNTAHNSLFYLHKVGDICLVTRGMDRNNKLATNTRVRIIAMNNNSIRVETIENIPQRHTIPRIRFKFRIPKMPSFHMTRMQFPLRLAYAVTINKSQGQSYDWVLVVLTTQCFAHGQAYVALSRSRYSHQTAFFGCDTMYDSSTGLEGACIQNVVFKDLLYNRAEHNKKKQELLELERKGHLQRHHTEWINVPDLTTLQALRADLEGDVTEEARDHQLVASNFLEGPDELDEEERKGDEDDILPDTAEDESFLSPPTLPPDTAQDESFLSLPTLSSPQQSPPPPPQASSPARQFYPSPRPQRTTPARKVVRCHDDEGDDDFEDDDNVVEETTPYMP